MTNADKALDYVADGMVVGLGTGRAATAFLHALAGRVHGGLRVRGVPTSLASARLAGELGIPLTSLDDVEALDVAVDGADEVDPRGNLVKGYGGALVREKIVAAAARRLVVLVGPEKLVPRLGSRGIVPVEVVPFGLAFVRRRLAALGYEAAARPAPSDNGNALLDCRVPPLEWPEGWEAAVAAIPGVLGTGLFLGMNPTVLVQRGGDVEVRP